MMANSTGALSIFQERILRVLSETNDWMTRNEMRANIRKRLNNPTIYKRGWAAAIGAHTTGIVDPDTLEGMGFAEQRNAQQELECRITNAGRSALKAESPQDEQDQELSEIRSNLESDGYFDPSNLEDERERKLREIVQRRGQPQFRDNLITAYSGNCAITRCEVVDALEAAHIIPYLGSESNHVSNGLLLRADIHTLFDLNYIGIDPGSLKVVLAEQLQGTCYDELDGQVLKVPSNLEMAPNKKALLTRWVKFVR